MSLPRTIKASCPVLAVLSTLVLPSALLAQGGGTRSSADIDVKALENSWSGGQGRETGLDVTSGDRLTVTVNPSQMWSAGSDDPCTRTSNADGLTECYGPFSSGSLSANYGSLVGRIGNGDPFLIGTAFDNQATGSGPLLLYYWDSNAYDNSGSIVAAIRLEKSPQGEPVRPDLTGVEIVEADTLDSIDEIAIGQSFRVRLTFAEDPGAEISETVTIRTSAGTEKVQVTGNTRVIVSEPILVAPAESDQTKVEQ